MVHRDLAARNVLGMYGDEVLFIQINLIFQCKHLNMSKSLTLVLQRSLMLERLPLNQRVVKFQ